PPARIGDTRRAAPTGAPEGAARSRSAHPGAPAPDRQRQRAAGAHPARFRRAAPPAATEQPAPPPAPEPAGHPAPIGPPAAGTRPALAPATTPARLRRS